jgi:hypothetical protein
MVNANIESFEMSYEESVSYFKRLNNSEKFRRNNGEGPTTVPVHNKKIISATSSIGNSSENHEASNMWCHYCDKNNHNYNDIHNTADCRAITISNNSNSTRIALKPKLDPE